MPEDGVDLFDLEDPLYQLVKDDEGFSEEAKQALKKVRLFDFIPEHYQKELSLSMPIPLNSRTFLPPVGTLLKMLPYIKPQATSRILIIGMGTAFPAVFASLISGEVYLTEMDRSLFAEIQSVKSRKKLMNLFINSSQKADFWKEKGPFDLIIVMGALKTLPLSLTSQLRPRAEILFSLQDESGFQLLIHMKREKQGNVLKTLDQAFFPSIEFRP